MNMNSTERKLVTSDLGSTDDSWKSHFRSKFDEYDHSLITKIKKIEK